MKRWPCVEGTIDLTCDKWLVRLWIDQEDAFLPLYADFEKIREHVNEGHEPVEIINFAREVIPTLNAIQLKEKEGETQFGIVVYLVDFAEHG